MFLEVKGGWRWSAGLVGPAYLLLLQRLEEIQARGRSMAHHEPADTKECGRWLLER